MAEGSTTLAHFTEANVRRWMRANLEDYRDGCDINLTSLAEEAADAFGQADKPGPLDDPDHWIWEVAQKVAEEIEELEDA